MRYEGAVVPSGMAAERESKDETKKEQKQKGQRDTFASFYDTFILYVGSHCIFGCTENICGYVRISGSECK